ncbi:MAG: cold shock domain-containing protein [bacterium]|nr:cold shock domain-containing protein [bacterium]
MGRSQETYSKKENEKKKQQKRKEKQERKEERKANSNKGKSFEEMLAYVDENGQLTSTPPDPNKKKVLNLDDIQLGAKIETFEVVDKVRNGTIISFIESKGYGFIKDDRTQENIFFHVNGLLTQVKERDKVSFETEQGKKGLNAISVRAI